MTERMVDRFMSNLDAAMIGASLITFVINPVLATVMLVAGIHSCYAGVRGFK